MQIFKKFLLNSSLQFKQKIIPNPIMQMTHKMSKPYSQLDRYLDKLQKPLYYYLIGINVGVFFAWNTGIISQKFLVDHFTFSKQSMRNLYLHTAITYSFSHLNFWHLATNMVTLFFFGKFVELYFGSKLLFQLYMSGAIGSAIFALSANNNVPYNVLNVGASGSTSAILSFFILNFPHEKIYIYFIPCPAWLFGGFFLIYSMGNYSSNGTVSHAGHLGGILSGLMMFAARKGRF